MKKQGPSIVLPLLKIHSELATKRFCESTAPTVRAVADAPQSRPEGMADLYASIFTAMLHEEGHKAAMLHLCPTSDPDIILNIRARLTKEGAGLSLEGARCGTAHRFEDGHERIVISIAGWLAEHTLLTLNEEKFPLPKLSGGALVHLFANDAFDEAFPGSANDSQEIRDCVGAMLADEEDFDDMSEDEKNAIMASIYERMSAAFDAAIRLLHGKRDDVIAAARQAAERLFAHSVEQLLIVGKACDSIRGAGLGVFTPEDEERRKTRKIVSIWEGSEDV